MRNAFAGTLQSNDCLIQIGPGKGVEMQLESPVQYEFGDQIRALVRRILAEAEISNVQLVIEDRGALDCTIEARLRAAIGRAK